MALLYYNVDDSINGLENVYSKIYADSLLFLDFFIHAYKPFPPC